MDQELPQSAVSASSAGSVVQQVLAHLSEHVTASHSTVQAVVGQPMSSSTAEKVLADKEAYLAQMHSSSHAQQALLVSSLVDLLDTQQPSVLLATSFVGFLLTRSPTFHKHLLATPKALPRLAALLHCSNAAAAAAAARALYVLTINRLGGRDIGAACTQAAQTPGVIEGLVDMLAQGTKPALVLCVLQNLSMVFIAGSPALAQLSASILRKPTAVTRMSQLLIRDPPTAADAGKVFLQQAPTAAAVVLGVLCEQGPQMCKMVVEDPTAVANLIRLLQPGGEAAAEAAISLGNLLAHCDGSTFIALTQGRHNPVNALVAVLQLGDTSAEAAAKALAKTPTNREGEYSSSIAMAMVAAPAGVKALLQLLAKGEAAAAAAVQIFNVLVQGSTDEAFLCIAANHGAVQGLSSIIQRGGMSLAVPGAPAAAAAAVCVLHQMLFSRKTLKIQLCALVLATGPGQAVADISIAAARNYASRPQLALAALEVVLELLQHADVDQHVIIASMSGIATSLSACLLPVNTAQQPPGHAAAAGTAAVLAGNLLLHLATIQCSSPFLLQQQQPTNNLVAMDGLAADLAGLAPVLQHLMHIPAFRGLSAAHLSALAAQQVHWQQQQTTSREQTEQPQPLSAESQTGPSARGQTKQQQALPQGGLQHAKDLTGCWKAATQPVAVVAPQAAGQKRRWGQFIGQPTQQDDLLFQQYQRQKARRKEHQEDMKAVKQEVAELEQRQRSQPPVDPDTPTSAFSIPGRYDSTSASRAIQLAGRSLEAEFAEAAWAEAAAAALKTNTTWLAGEDEAVPAASRRRNTRMVPIQPGNNLFAARTASQGLLPDAASSIIRDNVRRPVGGAAVSGWSFEHHIEQQTEPQQSAISNGGVKDVASGTGLAANITVEGSRDRVILGSALTNQLEVQQDPAQRSAKRVRFVMQL